MDTLGNYSWNASPALVACQDQAMASFRERNLPAMLNLLRERERLLQLNFDALRAAWPNPTRDAEDVLTSDLMDSAGESDVYRAIGRLAHEYRSGPERDLIEDMCTVIGGTPLGSWPEDELEERFRPR